MGVFTPEVRKAVRAEVGLTPEVREEFKKLSEFLSEEIDNDTNPGNYAIFTCAFQQASGSKYRKRPVELTEWQLRMLRFAATAMSEWPARS